MAPDASLPPSEVRVPAEEWHAYGRTEGGSHYSPLEQITPDNVGDLQEVWHYHTGDVRLPEDPEETTYEVTPLMVGGTLYLCTPHQIAIALDPETGEELWRFDSGSGVEGKRQHQTCRGVAYYEAAGAAANEPCGKRLFLPTADARLIALDATTGDVCRDFGSGGAVDLSANMPYFYEGSYYSTSPPVIARGLIVIGGAVNDNVSTTEPIPAIPTRRRRSRPMRPIRPTRRTPGRCSVSIPNSAWFTRRSATRRPINGAATGRRRPNASRRR
jgi:quinoprotein glucose dehydrogenase